MRPVRALMLADGSSDEPLGAHVAALARQHDIDLDVVTPDLTRLDPAPGLTVHGRLGSILEIDPDFELLVVHRDAEAQEPSLRMDEIAAGMDHCGIGWPVIPVIPIKMTEAWLLLDEDAIRNVAGRPSGSNSLSLPRPREAERIADPKAILQNALQAASGCSGRRLKQFKRDFPQQRRQLLERLDRSGPVKSLNAWRSLEVAVRDAADSLNR